MSADRGEPQRPWVAWLEPIEGCVIHFAQPRVARVISGAKEIEALLASHKVRVGRFTSEAKALAWLDDQRMRCSCCEDGKGKHRCPACQQSILTGQLAASVGGSPCR